MARKKLSGGQAAPPAANPRKKNTPAPPVDPKTIPIPLSPRHAAFVGNFMLHYNGSRAAKEAGFAKRSAGQIAHELLKRPDISAEITRRRALLAANLDDLSQERIKREIASLAMSNMKDFAPMFGSGTPAEKLALLTREQGAVVQEIVVEEFRDGRSDWREVRRTKFKLNDKGRSLELLARVSGMVIDKQEVQHHGLIMHAMLKEIDEETRGKPIVEIEARPVDKGEAA